MRRISLVVTLCLFAGAIGILRAPAATVRPLQIFSIDVEGGQSTLIVDSFGESLLIDTGWDGFDNRDANRIAAAAKTAGIKQIDYLLITHYHTDHVVWSSATGKADEKIGTFVDHGPEYGRSSDVTQHKTTRHI